MAKHAPINTPMESERPPMKKLPKWLETGEYYHENGWLGPGRLRIIRVLNGYRTHNIDLIENRINWETASSEELEFAFESEAAAKKWWKEKFGKAESFWGDKGPGPVRSR